MSEWIGTALVLLILLGLIFLAILSLRRDKKRGKGSCGGSCSSCPHACPHMSDEEIRKAIEEHKKGP